MALQPHPIAASALPDQTRRAGAPGRAPGRRGLAPLGLGLLAWLAVLCAGPALAGEPLRLYYFSRPPLYMADAGGKPGGILLELAERLLKRAGLEYRLVEMPPKRALLAIEQGDFACAVGWFRLPERERFAVFSLPVHRDAPMVAVVRRAVARELPQPATLDDLLSRPLTLGVIDGFNYGQAVERKLGRHKPRVQRVTVEVGQLMQMAALGRCDWFLLNGLEARWHLHSDPRLASELSTVDLTDQPRGNLRYLMCAPALGGAAMDRINRAILEMVGDLEKDGGRPQP